ncbi:RagB/SusD family nutrient uptake outer membrane protein [uncultured Acetobacteroides sp.]|uniref:RagB/SusD family nutrient uptake outer membrane protein n=1 Tax=uncultured Acetobacteroides sp. TaxID=1760811 RepID=UPI0029F47227|nr:RagB/SusD family nutrient uptake outer membrane protein [uncultured Acetobacteroides sp.]
MKRIKYFGIVVLSLFLFSCQKEFLDTTPTASVDAKNAFSSLDNAYAVINGIHRYMYNSGDYQDESGEASINLRRDMLGEDLCMTAAGNGWFNRFYQWTDHRNGQATANIYPWRFYYRIIANANAVIDGLNTKFADKKDDGFFQEIMAQALTYRAWAHFNLVQLYAKRYDPTKKGNNSQLGVVLSTTSEVLQRPRSTVEEVYAQINTDLNNAIALFKSSGSSPAQISDLSIYAAEAIKARVALTTGEWQTAIDYSSEALKAGKLFTAADFKANGGFPTIFSSYPGAGSEWIWGSQVKSDQNTYFASFFAYMSWNYSSTNIRTNPKTITRELYDAMPATDARKAMFSLTGYDIYAKAPNQLDSRALVASYETKKFSAVAPADSRGDIAYIRVAEMYLIKAEAEARIGGKDADAQNTLATLLTSRYDAGTYVKSANTGQALIDEILLQRRIELWGEGFRFTDLKRLDLPLARVITAVPDPAKPYKTGHITANYSGHHDPTLCVVTEVPAGDARWQWFIPKDEINANNLVIQNE